MVNYVTPDGKVISGEQMAKILEQKPGRKPATRGEAPQTYHKGWRVVGHAPGALEEAQKDAEQAWAIYMQMDPKRIMEKYPGGKGIPKPWDEAEWRRNSKLQAVRSKPYEVHSAALECMQLAERAGWTDLRIETLAKGEPPQQPGLL